MSNLDEAREAQRQMEAAAKPAEADTEAKLKELDRLQQARRKDPWIEQRYEQLRDEMVAQLRKEGPRYYIDENGQKRYAFAVQPETIEVDVDKLVQHYEAGRLPNVNIDELAPRKAHKENLRTEIARGNIPNEIVVDVLTIPNEPTTKGHVKVSKPLDEPG